jgi:hypothetical protein
VSSRPILEAFITDISDEDRGWGPLLFLRPRQDQQMTAGRMLVFAVLVGGAFGMLGSVLLAGAAVMLQRPAPPVYAMPALLTVLYLGACRLFVAPAWNARARRLAGETPHQSSS